jgi:glycosyltransferase involved in cell wall biosynthesis
MNEASENKKILYIFSGGRKERLTSEENFAKDFFYGFYNVKEKYPNTFIHEISHKHLLIFKQIDSFIKKLTHFPISFSGLFNKKLSRDMTSSSIVYLVNESVMFYSLPLIIFIKTFKKETRIILFTMGLFSNISYKNKRHRIQELIIRKICLRFIDKFYFLGSGEYKYAVSNFESRKNKFKLTPFGVDYRFWHSKEKYKLEKREHILFVGNDLNRDYELVSNLAKSMEDTKFVIVSSRFSELETIPKNVTLIDGMWWNNKISDSQIKKLYQKSIFSIIPLKESLQPSGQSVALQSMSSGSPVLITSTKGFWNPDKFSDNQNIFFINGNSLNVWKNRIEQLLTDEDLVYNVSKQAQLTVAKNFDLSHFSSLIIEDI